jgi:hypothetical protein
MRIRIYNPASIIRVGGKISACLEVAFSDPTLNKLLVSYVLTNEPEDIFKINT